MKNILPLVLLAACGTSARETVDAELYKPDGGCGPGHPYTEQGGVAVTCPLPDGSTGICVQLVFPTAAPADATPHCYKFCDASGVCPADDETYGLTLDAGPVCWCEGP